MKELPKRVLGRTGAAVTQLGFGAGERQLSDGVDGDGTSERVLMAALDAGINLIDTAPDYGASEERIGRFIGDRRDEFFLATKCGCNVAAEGEPLQPGHLWTVARMRANIDQSLRRLRTDRVDLLQMRNPSVQDVKRGDSYRFSRTSAAPASSSAAASAWGTGPRSTGAASGSVPAGSNWCRRSTGTSSSCV